MSRHFAFEELWAQQNTDEDSKRSENDTKHKQLHRTYYPPAFDISWTFGGLEMPFGPNPGKKAKARLCQAWRGVTKAHRTVNHQESGDLVSGFRVADPSFDFIRVTQQPKTALPMVKVDWTGRTFELRQGSHLASYRQASWWHEN